MRIGINGFGRIGRALYRVNNLHPYINIVVVNDINPDIENIFYTLKYDTLYGIVDEISLENNYIVNSKHNNKTAIVSNKNINEVNWSEYNLDYIIDSSGVVKSVKDSKKLINNKVIKKVFCTFSPDIEDFTMVLGANENDFDVFNPLLSRTTMVIS